MKIGVFGDSYAEKNSSDKAWWQRLIHDHGHEVECHGVAGSSIAFSMNLLERYHKRYDFNIWCFTTTGRFSVPVSPNEHWHSTGCMDILGNLTNAQSNEFDFLRDACQRYLKYVFDHDYENFVSRLIAKHFLDALPNLMLVPCFSVPLKSDFNLYDLCTKEIQTLFPNKQVHEIYQTHRDLRVCHLSDSNNRRLASLINANLQHGIFETSYDNFDFDGIVINDVLRPI